MHRLPFISANQNLHSAHSSCTCLKYRPRYVAVTLGDSISQSPCESHISSSLFFFFCFVFHDQPITFRSDRKKRACIKMHNKGPGGEKGPWQSDTGKVWKVFLADKLQQIPHLSKLFVNSGSAPCQNLMASEWNRYDVCEVFWFSK